MNKKHKTVAESLEEGFRDVGKLTAPREELLNGEIGNQILDDVLGRPRVQPRTNRHIKSRGRK